MYLKRIVTLFGVIMGAAIIMGCDDTTDPVDGVTFSGTITQGGIGNVLSGVSVCAVEPDAGCATTDDAGAWLLANLPKNTSVKFRLSLDGYYPVLVVLDVKEVDRNDVSGSLFDNGILQGIYTDAGITVDLSKGSIGIVLGDGVDETCRAHQAIAGRSRPPATVRITPLAHPSIRI